MREEESVATLAQSFYDNSAGVDWRIVLVKQNPTIFSAAFSLFTLHTCSGKVVSFSPSIFVSWAAVPQNGRHNLPGPEILDAPEYKNIMNFKFLKLR